LAIGAIPSKQVPRALDLLLRAYQDERVAEESFSSWVRRVGRRRVKEVVAPATEVRSFDEDPDVYRDWGDPRTYSIGDVGTGECAGEVISPSQFAFAESERLLFEAQLKFEEDKLNEAQALALEAMFAAARAVVLPLLPGLRAEPEQIGEAFDRWLGHTGLFDAAFPGGNFSRYFVRARQAQAEHDVTAARAHQALDEAQMFVDAAHEYEAKRDQLRAPQAAARDAMVAP
jgi:sulfite reductase (ferredoxin)